MYCPKRQSSTDASVFIASSPIRVLFCVIKENCMFEIRRGQYMLREPRYGLQCTYEYNGMVLVSSACSGIVSNFTHRASINSGRP